MSSKRKNSTPLRYLNLWLPVVFHMILIFYFSSRPAGSVVLEEFPFSAPIGHIFGYFFLGILLYRALNDGRFSWQMKAALLTIASGLLYAISDELHQLFVPGRQAALIDIFYDILGLLLALFIIRLIPPGGPVDFLKKVR